MTSIEPVYLCRGIREFIHHFLNQILNEYAVAEPGLDLGLEQPHILFRVVLVRETRLEGVKARKIGWGQGVGLF